MIIKLAMLCIGINNKVNIHTITFKTMRRCGGCGGCGGRCGGCGGRCGGCAGRCGGRWDAQDVSVALIAGTGGLFKYRKFKLFYMKERCKTILHFSFML